MHVAVEGQHVVLAVAIERHARVPAQACIAQCATPLQLLCNLLPLLSKSLPRLPYCVYCSAGAACAAGSAAAVTRTLLTGALLLWAL